MLYENLFNAVFLRRKPHKSFCRFTALKPKTSIEKVDFTTRISKIILQLLKMVLLGIIPPVIIHI